jgi:glutamyl-tRNA synthetase
VAWETIRPNLTRLADAADWWKIVKGPVESAAAPDDAEFLAAAARVAAAIDWTTDPWHALTNALKTETDRKGKALFLPLRRALTGLDHGPDMAALLPLIGRAEALVRLSA